jgi:hypothetical protein
MTLLMQHCADANAASVNVNMERLLKVWKCQDQSRAQGILKFSESRLLRRSPSEWGILFEQGS